MHWRRRIRDGGATLAAAAAAPWLVGCEIVGVASVMAESYKRTSTHAVSEEYTGLSGKSFAVMVVADRALQADMPALVPTLTVAMTERLRENANGSGYVPAGTMVRFVSENPRAAVLSPAEIAQTLGVERLVHVELLDFRLHEPGNAHLWDGLASARVGVLEADGAIPDDFAYRKDVTVRFPSQSGVSRSEMQETIVQSRLITRLVDRVVWNFYEHQEPYYPEY